MFVTVSLILGQNQKQRENKHDFSTLPLSIVYAVEAPNEMVDLINTVKGSNPGVISKG